jgi:hypothetical protein
MQAESQTDQRSNSRTQRCKNVPKPKNASRKSWYGRRSEAAKFRAQKGRVSKRILQKQYESASRIVKPIVLAPIFWSYATMETTSTP